MMHTESDAHATSLVIGALKRLRFERPYCGYCKRSDSVVRAPLVTFDPAANERNDEVKRQRGGDHRG